MTLTTKKLRIGNDISSKPFHVTFCHPTFLDWHLQDIISKTESFRKTQSEIDNIYSSLCDTIITEMDNCIPRCDTSKKTRKRLKRINHTGTTS